PRCQSSRGSLHRVQGWLRDPTGSTRLAPRSVRAMKRSSWLAFGGGAVALAAMWARADAPPGRYTVMSGTVRDNQTMLTWQQTLDAGTLTWSGASTYCAALGLDGGGFRVPS